jgi:hypothetical protein
MLGTVLHELVYTCLCGLGLTGMFLLAAPCAQVPNITRTEYTLVDVNEEGFVSQRARA